MGDWGIANRIEQVNGYSGGIQVVDEVALTAYQQTSVKYRVKETDVLWCASVAVSTADGGTFAHRTEFKSESRFLDNDYVRSENFWGTAQHPLRHAPKFLPLNGEIEFHLIETSNQAHTVALYLYVMRANVCQKTKTASVTCPNPNCKCDRARWGSGRGLYVHTTPGPTTSGGGFSQNGIVVPAGGPKTLSVKVIEPYHFRSAIQNGCAFNGASGITANTAWKGNLTRRDPRDERGGTLTSAQNQQARAAAFVGTATAPLWLPSSVLFHKASSIDYDVTDLGGSTTNYVHIAQIGETLDDELLNMCHPGGA
jgi:hypothetical protein